MNRSRYLISFSIAALLAPVLPAMADHERGGVTLYTEGNFRGQSESFSQDDPDLSNNRIGNDHASSVRIARGCRARLYAGRDYRGAFADVFEDQPDLRRTALGNDHASSIKIRCGWDDWNDGRVGRPGFPPPPVTPPSSGGSGVTIYSETGFRGSSDTLRHGHDVANLTATRVGNDRLSSVRIDRGCRVRLFTAGDFRGDWLELRSDVDNLDFTALRNGTVSSLKVRCDGVSGWDGNWGGDGGDRDDHGGQPGNQPGAGFGVTLFAGGDFRGVSETFDRDVPNLSNTRIGNDAASSVRVPAGCHARLYRHSDYRGEYAELRFDERDLSNTPVGNDGASSLMVRCDARGRGGFDDRRGSVTLYRGGDFRDVSETFYDDVSSLAGTQVGNDTASSITITRGCTVWLYRGGNYQGEYAELRFDEPNLGRTPVGNDTVSSLRLRCDR